MKGLFALLVALVVVLAGAVSSEAALLGRRGGGNMGGGMVCNNNQVAGPVAATPADLQAAPSQTVLNKNVALDAPVFAAKKTRTGFSAADIAGLAKPAKASNVASK